MLKRLPKLPHLKRRYKILISIFAGLIIVAGTWALLSSGDMPVLNTKGIIADTQRDLIIFTVVLSVVVVVPVFTLLAVIAWRFREGNTKAKYTPEWDHNHLLEAVWWGLPCAIIVLLSIVIWTSSHALDPYRAIDNGKEPVQVQVVALQWKWLFLYPEEGVATVNHVKFPVNTPVNFKITADAPMNSFWIPSLGGQVYAMSGMSTKLHLMASEVGSYKGSSANISGEGFAGMKFTADAKSDIGYKNWLQEAKASAKELDTQTYEELAKPSKDVAPATYRLTKSDLYDTIVDKYMGHGTDEHHAEGKNH